MTCNVGGIDRGIRAVLGTVFLLAALFVTMDTLWRVVLFVLAGIAFFTVFARYCPVNSAIGLNTCRDKPAA
ncbi:DUF2892 domain-containing protein [Falsiroseomonas sp.]|uniref:YgaP family membrane protein n=1 Tax=Falsiroseomonas sp. TaxID=2870721 RepID=UPI0035670217